MNARDVMARALVKRNYPNATEADLAEMVEGFMPDAEAALSAIEAAGMAIVPVDRIDALLSAARTASYALGELIEHTGDDMNDSRAEELDKIDAMIAAAKDQTDGRQF